MARIFITFVLAAMSLAAFADDPTGYTAIDNRIPITVTNQERNQTLYEMRDLLHGLFNLHLALSKNDYRAAAIVARPLGHLMEKLPASMKERLPEEYIQLALAMQESFDVLARDGEKNKDISQVESQLSETMTYCSGCHDTYRFKVGRISAK